MPEQIDIKRAAKAIEALDFSEENSRVAGLEEERRRIDDARDRAETRQAAIKDILASVSVHDGHAVAQALLAGSPTLPHEGREALNEEANALSAGVRELDQRMRTISTEIDSVRRGAERKTLVALTPLLESLVKDAREGAEVIMRAYSGLQAVEVALGCNIVDARRVRKAIGSLRGPDFLIPYTQKINVDPDIKTLIAPLAEKGAGLNVWNIVDEVTIH